MIKQLISLFKWTFILMAVDLLIHCAERIYRVVREVDDLALILKEREQCQAHRKME